MSEFLKGKQQGRPRVYTTPMMIKAFLVMVCYRLTSVRSLARFLGQHSEVAALCGFQERTPCYRTLCRRFKTLDCWALEYCRMFITFFVDTGLISLNTLIIDGTPAKSQCKPPKIGKSTRLSDKEARFGFRYWGKDCYFGYKINILCTAEPVIIPLSWIVIPANKQEVSHLIPTVSKAAWLFEKEQTYELVGDAGFDSQKNYDWCEALNIRFTCPLNKRNKPKGKRLQRQRFYESKKGQTLYTRRTDIERLNGQLKQLFLIDPLAVKGLKNVQSYINLVILAYLASVYYNCQNGNNPRSIKSIIA